ncbi:hypothetical protein GA0115247_13173 [Streptomyces sp. PalvLS-984]|nr:hypothetical protein GA0115247_13173 [Streptomyces sp. PalvLS-984]
MSTDAKRSWGPLTENLDLPRNLDLGNRRRALQQLKINETAHNHMVAKVHEHLPQQEAALLVSTRQWPLLAARMHRMHRDGMPVDQHLARLAPDDATWRHGQPSETPANLLLATHHALTTPPSTRPCPQPPASPAPRPAPARPPHPPHPPAPRPRPDRPYPRTASRPPPHPGKDADGRTAAAPTGSDISAAIDPRVGRADHDPPAGPGGVQDGLRRIEAAGRRLHPIPRPPAPSIPAPVSAGDRARTPGPTRTPVRCRSSEPLGFAPQCV